MTALNDSPEDNASGAKNNGYLLFYTDLKYKQKKRATSQ
jgi:hypothetical protein